MGETYGSAKIMQQDIEKTEKIFCDTWTSKFYFSKLP